MGAERLDKALVERGLTRSRGEAQALLEAGQISVNASVTTRASLRVVPADEIRIAGERLPYVSRGGLKLKAALDRFQIDVQDKTALDVGASTGGWTDCLLQSGAAHVVALDVGHGQMAPALRLDSRVELREGVNARFLRHEEFTSPFCLLVADLSFISLTLVLSALAPLLDTRGDMILLVKPQFEVGAEHLGKGGIVRNAGARLAAVERVIQAAHVAGLREMAWIESPVTGTNGNVEFLLHLQAGTDLPPWNNRTP